MLAGCASASSTQEPSAPAATLPLATSLAAAGGGAWAVVAVGGSAGSENTFWELFTRPAASSQWKLVTPPGIADNGGLVAAAPADGQRLDIAILPSQGLTFSPLALTGDGGNTWDTGLVDAAVAAVPDAFAAAAGRCSPCSPTGPSSRPPLLGATGRGWPRPAPWPRRPLAGSARSRG